MPSSFIRPLILEYIPETNMWKIVRKLVYFVGEEGSNDRIIVPKDFITDLKSVPWPAVMFIPKSGKSNQSAVLHDYLYSIRGEISEPGNMKKRTRKECDGIFKESMQILGVHWFKLGTIFNAVRLGGWLPWKKHKLKPTEKEK